MLQTQNKVVVPDLKGKNDVSFEVNFSDNPDLKECVKVEINGSEAIIPIKDFYGFVFVIANEEQQERMLPVRQTTVRKITKLHKIQAQKNIKKGEFVVARCETNVPVEIFEGLKGMMGKKIHTTGGIPIIKAK